MSVRRRTGERARAADPVANPYVRRPELRDPLLEADLVALLNGAVGEARAAAELETTYALRAKADGDVRGESAHDLLAQTHDAYAKSLATLARIAIAERENRGTTS